MPVIINEFEIEPTNPPDGNGAQQQPTRQEGGSPSPLSPQDIQEVIRRQLIRRLRLIAY